MSFKEKLKRYKEGTASTDEIDYVEKELEKYESIEEYYSENISDLFLSEDSYDEAEINEEDTKHVQKIVNRRLRNVILVSVLAVVILYLIIFNGISSIVDSLYYNPTITSQPTEEYAQRSDFHYDMSAYVSLNMPGFALASTTSELAQGFGNYELGYSLNNLFTDDQQLHFMNISRNRLTLAHEGIFNHPNRSGGFRGFDSIYYPLSDYKDEGAIALVKDSMHRNNDITLDYLNELNGLSYVSMSIVFKEDLSMEEFHLLRDDHSDLDFKWVGVRTTEPKTRWSENQPMSLIGFNPNFNAEPSFGSRPDPELYPYFYLDDVMMLETAIPMDEFPNYYETHFKSRLNYLSQQEDFINLFDSYPNKAHFYKDALNYINEEGMETYGVLVYGTVEEFLEAIDDISYDALYMNDVLPAKPFIY